MPGRLCSGVDGAAGCRAWTVDDLALALRLADAADAVTLPRFRAADLQVRPSPTAAPSPTPTRPPRTCCAQLIAAERPDDAVLGEEGGGSVGTERGWALDPIDGTKNFSRACRRGDLDRV